MKYYAGIGSRDTPMDIQKGMAVVAKKLAMQGYTLRSGGADKADKAFEIGCDAVDGRKEIYLPWYNFNNNRSPLYDITEDALTLAEKFHPAWGRLKPAAKKLMARNCYQVLGYDLNTPVDFIVCWTLDGKASGGTGQALRIAEAYGIEIYNLYHEEARKGIKELVG